MALLAARGIDALWQIEPGVRGRRRVVVWGGLWVAGNATLAVIFERATAFPWSQYWVFAKSHLVGEFLVGAILFVLAMVALAICRSLSSRHRATGIALIFVVTAADLFWFNTSHVRLVEAPALRIAPELEAICRETSEPMSG